MIFLNLTNGLEYNGDFDGLVRIQSTACEQKRWDFIIQELDYSFLMPLYLGKEVKVIDFGARKELSRAIYQGLQWTEYCLNRRWFDIDSDCFVKDHNAKKYFNEIYTKLDRKTKIKLDYFKRFSTNAEKVNISKESFYTNNDGNNIYYSYELDCKYNT